MGISKLKIANGETKWQVRVWENGRGSRRINRRFDRRTDAEAFLGIQQQYRRRPIPISL
jgi:hypothetical protein